MSPKRMLSLVSVLALVAPTIGFATPPSRLPRELAKEAPNQVREEVSRATRETESQLREVAEAIRKSQDLTEVRKKAQDALTQSREDTAYYSDLSRELSYQKEELEKDKSRLSEDKEKLWEGQQELEREKQELKREKQLYSMGFYASLATVLVGVVGLVVRYPLNKLERELRALELLERQHELREKGVLRDSEAS